MEIMEYKYSQLGDNLDDRDCKKYEKLSIKI